ncbi:hypothetical protein RGU70_10065 [Herbaspirillum sp. RTI4]|uniref:hypothetical protein n=1 Tax=Herbaspirillum sp. RTI4 TaxID=3048640 RepID=UPI002AB500FE|nr:hypothetical protein [Herbaspirillum sp. RTI4]MDY7578667.1 hypothetical protein [Herbaspirillum sp. RTI4]MEA9980635.1 hypothetical protein [Herbaspirillum sp. RTI4]
MPTVSIASGSKNFHQIAVPFVAISAEKLPFPSRFQSVSCPALSAPLLACHPRPSSNWRRFLSALRHPLQPVHENNGLHEVLTQLEECGLSNPLEQQLEEFISPFLEPLARYLDHQPRKGNSETRFAEMLRQAWSADFPAPPSDLLTGLHAAYNVIAEERGHKQLESSPGQIGRALLSLFAQKIAGELCLLLAQIATPQLEDLRQLRRYLHPQVEYAPAKDAERASLSRAEMQQAVRLLIYEMENMAQTGSLAAPAAPDADLAFRDILLRQVSVALREGPYGLEQLLPPGLATLTPQRPRDWGLVFLCASAGCTLPAGMRNSATTATAPPSSMQAVPPRQSVVQRMHSSAISLWEALPALPHLPTFPPLAGAMPLAVATKAPLLKQTSDNLEIFLTKGVEEVSELKTVYDYQWQIETQVLESMRFVPDRLPEFLSHSWVIDKLRQVASKEEICNELILWHQNTPLESKAATLMANADLADDWKSALKIDWYHNGISVPPMARLASAIRRDGLNGNNLSELFSLTHYAPKLFTLEPRQQAALQQWAVHAWKNYLANEESLRLAGALNIIKNSAQYFKNKAYGYDRFYSFHQYTLSHAGFGKNHCLPTALLYLFAGGNHALLDNMRHNLGQVAAHVQDAEIFKKNDLAKPASEVIPPGNALPPNNLEKARFIAATFHALHLGGLFREESKFGSRHYRRVSTPEEVSTHLQSLPEGMHLLFHQHDLNNNAIGHTCVLKVIQLDPNNKHYYFFDPTFGEFRFRNSDALTDFVRHATTQNIVPSLFYFKNGLLKGISIVQHADAKLQKRLQPARFEVLRQALPQLIVPFDKIQIAPAYAAAFLPQASDMDVFDRILMLPDALPPAIRQTIPAEALAAPDEALEIELTQTRCVRHNTPCISEALQIKNNKGAVVRRITDTKAIAHYRQNRIDLRARIEIQWLLNRARLSDLLLSNSFVVTIERPLLRTQYVRLVALEMHERIQLQQYTQSIAQSICLHAAQKIIGLLQFYDSAMTGKLPALGWQAAPQFHAALKWMNAPNQAERNAYRRRALFGKIVSVLNIEHTVITLLLPDLPRENQEYMLQQLSKGIASAVLGQTSASLLGWAAARRLSNLSPLHLRILANMVENSLSSASNLFSKTVLSPELKAALARNLVSSATKVPGLLRQGSNLFQGSMEFFGTAAVGTSTALSLARMGVYANQLVEINDPDRYTIVTGKLAFSVVDASASVGILVAYGAGMTGAASGIGLFLVLIGVVTWMVENLHFAPLEQRAGLRLVNQTLTELHDDYRSPLNAQMHNQRLELNFNLVENISANQLRHRWNAVDLIDLSRIAEGKIGIKAGNATIAQPIPYQFIYKNMEELLQREPFYSFGPHYLPVMPSKINSDPHRRFLLKHLCKVPDWQWMDTPSPENATHIVIYAPDGKADVDISWNAGSLHTLEDQELNGPFPELPLRLNDGNYITELHAKPQAISATRIVAGGDVPLVCIVFEGKPVELVADHHTCILLMLPNAKASIRGVLLPGSAIVFGDEETAPVFGLGVQTVHWEGNILHVESAQIDLSAARATGPLMVTLRGVHYLLHLKTETVSSKSGFTLAGAALRISHIDCATLPEPDSITMVRKLDLQKPYLHYMYGVSQFGVVSILNGMYKVRPELFPLPVHILDKNNITLFYDPAPRDLFSPQAAGWRGQTFVLMAKKSGLGGPLWLVRNEEGVGYTSLRKQSGKNDPRSPVTNIPPEGGNFNITDTGESYRLEMKVQKVWQAGDVVKFLSDQSLIYSLALNGKPMLCGAQADWWGWYFNAQDKRTELSTLDNAFPTHADWLHLSLPNHDVLHINTRQQIALLTAPDDNMNPVQYRSGKDDSDKPTVTLQRVVQNGDFELTRVDVSQIAHHFSDFTASPQGVTVAAGKTAYLPLPPPAAWWPTQALDIDWLISPGQQGLGILSGISADALSRLMTRASASAPLGQWLSEQLHAATLIATVELAPTIHLDYGMKRTLFHVETQTMAIAPDDGILLGHNDRVACFYTRNDATLQSARFQSLEGLSATDLLSVPTRLNQTVDAPPVSLSRFNASLHEVTIIEDSLRLTTEDGRVLEFPADLNFMGESNFAPPLIRLASHWFSVEKISPTDTATISRTLRNRFMQDSRYTNASVIVPDVIAISLPRVAGISGDGYYLPGRGQYISPPPDAAIAHADEAKQASLQPVNITLNSPYSLWKRAVNDYSDESWHYLTDGIQWTRLGKMHDVELYGENGNVSFSMIPANDAKEGVIAPSGKSIRHYVVWRDRPAHPLYTLYLQCQILPLNEMSIWLLGNDGHAGPQIYSLVVSSQLSLVPGSLGKTRVNDAFLVYTAELKDKKNNRLKLYFAQLGPSDQVLVHRGLDHRQRDVLLVASSAGNEND